MGHLSKLPQSLLGYLQAPTEAQPAVPRSSTLALSTGPGPKGPTLLDEEGNEVILKGLSVFGFNSV